MLGRSSQESDLDSELKKIDNKKKIEFHFYLFLCDSLCQREQIESDVSFSWEILRLTLKLDSLAFNIFFMKKK